MNAERSRTSILEDKLGSIGIPIQSGAEDPKTEQVVTFSSLKNGKLPLCSVWYNSEIPDEEEVFWIKRLAIGRSALVKNPGDFEGYWVKGANTIILRKRDGFWQFRRLLAAHQPWSVPKAISEIVQNF